MSLNIFSPHSNFYDNANLFVGSNNIELIFDTQCYIHDADYAIISIIEPEDSPLPIIEPEISTEPEPEIPVEPEEPEIPVIPVIPFEETVLEELFEFEEEFIITEIIPPIEPINYKKPKKVPWKFKKDKDLVNDPVNERQGTIINKRFISYILKAEDIPVPGIYRFNPTVVWNDGTISTGETVLVRVRAKGE